LFLAGLDGSYEAVECCLQDTLLLACDDLSHAGYTIHSLMMQFHCEQDACVHSLRAKAQMIDEILQRQLVDSRLLVLHSYFLTFINKN
jgi:hypothetical protein